MDIFESLWRKKINKNTEKHSSKEAQISVERISDQNPISYTDTLIKTLKEHTLDEKIKCIFSDSACHIPHQKLESAKLVYQETKSIEATRKALESSFKEDIKNYKNLSDEHVDLILKKGWGLAGTMNDDKIIATKIPSKFHEYFLEEDLLQKKAYYCHCPRVRSALTKQENVDSLYCYCGGGFYQDVWEYITNRKTEIKLLKSLFKDDTVCQFEITITDHIIQ